MSNGKKVTSRIDYGQLFIIFILGFISCLAIYSIQITDNDTTNYVMKQIIFYLIGFGIVFFVMQLDSDQLKKASWYVYGFGLFLLFVLMISPESIAKPINGAKSWFQIPGFSLQPSEFMKIFLIITLANVIQTHNTNYEKKTIKTDFQLLGKLVLFTMLPIGLIMLQPDLGSSLVLIAILIGMTFVSGITWRLLIPLFALGASLVVGVLYLVLYKPEWLETVFKVKRYQFDRIYSWLDPESYPTNESYQLLQSLSAIGSGQVTGKGFGNREVKIVEGHSDFIFGLIGEEYGFIGAAIVVILFFILIYSWTRIALETKNEFNSYICIGIISMMTFHVFENIGMTIGLLPITGIPLPFLSYGGSSLWSCMMALGLVFSIRYHHKVYMFSTRA